MRTMCAGVGSLRGWRNPGKMRKQEKEKKWLATSSLPSRMFLQMALADSSENGGIKDLCKVGNAA